MIKEIVLGGGGEGSIKDEDSREGEEIQIEISSATVSCYMYYEQYALYTFKCLSIS